MCFIYNLQKTTTTVHNYTLYLQKNNTDVAYYNFNAHQLIYVIFGKDVAQRVC